MQCLGVYAAIVSTSKSRQVIDCLFHRRADGRTRYSAPIAGLRSGSIHKEKHNVAGWKTVEVSLTCHVKDRKWRRKHEQNCAFRAACLVGLPTKKRRFNSRSVLFSSEAPRRSAGDLVIAREYGFCYDPLALKINAQQRRFGADAQFMVRRSEYVLAARVFGL